MKKQLAILAKPEVTKPFTLVKGPSQQIRGRQTCVNGHDFIELQIWTKDRYSWHPTKGGVQISLDEVLEPFYEMMKIMVETQELTKRMDKAQVQVGKRVEEVKETLKKTLQELVERS